MKEKVVEEKLEEGQLRFQDSYWREMFRKSFLYFIGTIADGWKIIVLFFKNRRREFSN